MFNRIMDSLKRAFRNEKGQGMVEYILIVVLIALVAWGAFSALGTSVDTKTNDAADAVDGVDPDAACLYMVR